MEKIFQMSSRMMNNTAEWKVRYDKAEVTQFVLRIRIFLRMRMIF